MENTLKLLLPLTVTLLLCINPAAGLTCHKCATENCPDSADTRDCFDYQDTCVTTTFNKIVNGKSTIGYARRCDVASRCKSVITSMTTQQSTVVARVKCCHTDKCNHDSLPIPSAPPGEPVECPVCETDKGPCTSMKCGARDTKCFDYDDTSDLSSTKSKRVSGCVSSNACGDRRMMESLYVTSTDNYAGTIPCQDPPKWCKMCLDPEQSCAEPAHSGMRCMSATVEENNKVTIDLRGMAGAPLCSSDGSKSHHHDGKKVNVKCCSSSNQCNKDAPPQVSPDSDQPCTSDDCLPTPELIEQLQKIVEGQNFIPPHDASSDQPAQPDQPETSEHHDQGDNGNEDAN